MDHNTLVFAITQTGETADTLAALREVEAQGAPHPGASATSSAAPSPARPTAASTCTPARRSAWPRPRPSPPRCAVLAMLALYFGRMRHLSFATGMRIIERAAGTARAGRAGRLQCNDAVRRIAEKYADCNNFLYLGRQFNFPDRPGRGAQAQGNQLHPRRRLSGRRDEARPHRPGRSQHAQRLPRCRSGEVYDKVMANLQEIKARGGPVIAVAGEGRHGGRAAGRRRDRRARGARVPAADRHRDPAAAAGLPHRRRRAAATSTSREPGQERDGGVERQHKRAAGFIPAVAWAAGKPRLSAAKPPG